MTFPRQLAAALALTAVACSGGGYSSGTGTVTSPSPPAAGTTATTTFSVAIAAANESPAVSNAESGLTGTATVAVRATKDASGNVSSATADFQFAITNMLSSTTLTMAHIHRGSAGANGGIVVDTGMTSTTASSVTRTGINIAPDVAQAILNDPSAFYFNVHSALNPAGVVRGQLSGGGGGGGGDPVYP